MNKLLTKIVGAALGLSMTVGVGVAVASNANRSVEPARADVVAGEATYTFSEHSDYDDWSTDYTAHTLSYSTGVDVVFTSANKQSATSTINDRPVTKGQPVELLLPANSGYYISAFTFNALQWGTKKQAITAHYSTDRGENYTAISGTSNNFSISKTSSNMGNSTSVNAIKITFSSSSNQVGLTSFVVTYTAKPTVAVSSVSLDKDAISIGVGASETLTATVLPADATNKNVTWESDDEDVATVADGVVTGVAAGTANITVKSVADNTKTASCAVTVTAPIAVSSVSLNKNSVSIPQGETETLTATVLPADASNKNVVWESSNESVATVADGVVTGVAAGSATITVKSAADNTKTDTCSVTVVAPLISGGFASIGGGNLENSANNYDQPMTDGSRTWSVSAVERYNTGYVLGEYGVANTDAKGKWATFSKYDNFANLVLGIQQNSITTTGRIYAMMPKTFGIVNLSKIELSWTGRYGSGITAYILASNDGGLTWSNLGSKSVDDSAATLKWAGNTYSDGKTVEFAFVTVSTSTAQSVGARNISWNIYGTSINDSATWKAAAVTVSGDSSVEIGSTITLTATLSAQFATDSVTWSSSDETVATVNASTGVVTGVKAGSATITATTTGGKTGSLTVTVVSATVHVSSVELDEDSLAIKQAGSATLTATVLPADATDKSVSWSITGDSDISVDQNGKVTVAKTATVGDTATVTVTTTDGGKTASCLITASAFEADYHILTSVDKLHDGMKIVIGDVGGEYAAGSLNSGKYLNRVSATVINGGLVSENAQEFTLRGKVNAWQLENSEGKNLGLVGSGNNNLALTTSGSGNAYEWTISYSDSKFSIRNNNTSYTSRDLQYNSGSGSRFSNYNGSGANVAIYAADSDDNVLTFIRNYMRMGDTTLTSEEDTGTCKSTGSNYYLTAKAALASLSGAERSAFENNTGSKYTEALKRYKAWAAACKDGAPFDGETTVVTPLGSANVVGFVVNATNTAALIAIVSVISLSAVAGYFMLRKRKEQ